MRRGGIRGVFGTKKQDSNNVVVFVQKSSKYKFVHMNFKMSFTRYLSCCNELLYQLNERELKAEELF
jgi:hypothetical protein